MRGPIRLRVLGAVVCGLLCTSAALGQGADPVRVEGGLIAGAGSEAPSVRVYRGVPYAAPPVEALRWRPPQPPPAWDGVLEATTFGDGCVQDVVGSRPPWTEPFMHQGAVSEDCLYLNVWTAAGPEDGRPVLVYVHGGGFNEGSGSVALYDGAALARKGLVVVTVNYRVGVLGFLAHPALTEESPHDASGNYGLLDQVAALRWVQANIAAFGGDPDRVTIAGQSAGAMSVVLLTASPLAQGLFHRAIAQSGPGGLASFGVRSTGSLASPLHEAEAAGAAFAERLGAPSLQALRATAVAALTAAPTADAPPTRFRPVVDGYFLPDGVSARYAAGKHHDVPFLTGFNADEASAFPGYGQATVEAFEQTARERYGAAASAFLALYPARTDAAAGEAQKASLRDLGAVALARLAADRAQTAEAPTYLYYFERGIPWPERPEFGAFHTGEVPYVFDNLRLLDRPWEPIDRRLADLVSSYWVNFAATGDPNGEGLPQWPAYGEAPQMLMVLGKDVAPREMPADEARRRFLERQISNPPPR